MKKELWYAVIPCHSESPVALIKDVHKAREFGQTYCGTAFALEPAGLGEEDSALPSLPPTTEAAITFEQFRRDFAKNAEEFDRLLLSVFHQYQQLEKANNQLIANALRQSRGEAESA